MEQPGFYKETSIRLANVERRLSAANASASINIMGVAHEWKPGQKIISQVSAADIVTMELTRKVVQAGLAGTDSIVLAKNIFWNQLLAALKDEQDGKRIKGIGVNQTPRVAWKRFSLHHDIETLAASSYTVEVTPGNETCLDAILELSEIETLAKYHWLISDDPRAFVQISEAIVEALKNKPVKPEWPIKLNQDLTLVCYNDKASRNRQYKTTFISPPHPSLDQTAERVREKLANAPGKLTDDELRDKAMDVLLTYLLSPSELTEAEEIGYTINQYLRADLKPGQNSIQALHIGGAFHAQTIADILTDCLPENSSRIDISTSYDPRMGTIYAGNIFCFFRDHIKFTERMKSVSFKGFEVAVDPEQISAQVDSALGANGEDFEKRIAIERILEKKFEHQRGVRKARNFFNARAELYGLTLRELRDLSPK